MKKKAPQRPPLQQLVLAKVLLEDPFPQMGATHDIEPFGAYVTIDDGSIVFNMVEERGVVLQWV